jgi:hypothetical protein
MAFRLIWVGSAISWRFLTLRIPSFPNVELACHSVFNPLREGLTGYRLDFTISRLNLRAATASQWLIGFVCTSNLYDQFFEAGEAQLKKLRTSVCQTPDENAALNVAIAGNPRTPEPDAVRQFLAEARKQARGYPGENVVENHLLNRLVTFTEEDLIALRPYAAHRPAALVVIDRLQTLMFTP